jgi:outer membrane lipoprotein-sorting protein
MRKLTTFIAITLLTATCASAQQSSFRQKKKPAAPSKAANAKTAAPTANPADPNAQLEAVLTQLDKASVGFRTAEADFVWDQFQAIVQEHDLQKGKVYFARHEKDTHMAADITEPDKKQVVFSEGKIRLYQPKIDQITEYEASGKNREEVESFMVLGFGGRGHDLTKQFDVKYLGEEVIDGIKTVKLDLVPKAEKVRNMFSHFTLWMDPARDVSLKQQAFEPSGDYRTATYSNIKINEKVPDEIFKIKTTQHTKVVRPQ